MPLYDYQCKECGATFETLMPADDSAPIDCPNCGATERAHRIISLGRGNSMPEDAGWIRSVLEVVDKRGGPHCQEFLRHPTRSNWKAWMKGENLRPIEEGEAHLPQEKSTKEIKAEVMPQIMAAHRKRTRVEVHGNKRT